MMKYSELIKIPVKTVSKRDLNGLKKEIAKLKGFHNSVQIVAASVADDILIVELYKLSGGALKLEYRHFFSKTEEKYVTQKIAEQKKGTGTISTSLRWYGALYTRGAKKTVLDYLGEQKETYPLGALCSTENKVIEARRQERYDKITKVIDERMAVIPEKPPQEFYDWLRDVEYVDERYFIYTRFPKSKTQYGICTFCKTKFSAPAKNGNIIVCPKCGSKLLCRSKGRCASVLDNWGNVSYVEIVTDTDGKPALLERVFYTKSVIRNTSSWENNLQTEINAYETERRFYKPESGLNAKYNDADEWFYYWDAFLASGETRWCSNNQGVCPYREKIKVFPGNLNELVNEYLPELKNVDMSAIAAGVRSEFKRLYVSAVKYPAVENLAKQGLTSLAREFAEIAYTGRGISVYDERKLTCYTDIAQRSAAGFLGVSRPEIRLFAGVDISPKEYRCYMEIKRRFGMVSISDVIAIVKGGYDVDTVIDLFQYGCTPQKLSAYLDEQRKLPPSPVNGIEHIFLDYLRTASIVYGGLNANIRYPRCLEEEHDKVMEIYESKKDALYEQMLTSRAKLLEELDFSDKKYMIFPLRTTNDFINESKMLHHCVKTYIKNCALGKTNIFALRKSDKPDKPYFTVNIGNDGRLIQNRGVNNCDPPKAVKSFVNKWIKFVEKKLKTLSLEPGGNTDVAAAAPKAQHDVAQQRAAGDTENQIEIGA